MLTKNHEKINKKRDKKNAEKKNVIKKTRKKKNVMKKKLERKKKLTKKIEKYLRTKNCQKNRKIQSEKNPNKKKYLTEKT